jgi:hypothetical protein
MEEETEGRKHGWLEGGRERWMDAWIDEQMIRERWMDGRRDG